MKSDHTSSQWFSRFGQGAMLVLGLALSVRCLSGQGFDSGSNGSYGPLVVADGARLELALPEDGIFHCTTVSIPQTAWVTFVRNARNTPVYLLATGDVTINGMVFVDGRFSVGGPGGFDGGARGYVRVGSTIIPRLGGDGGGPGGGRRGTSLTVGSAGFGSTSRGPTGVRGHGTSYGSALLLPLVGGSGGGGLDGKSGLVGDDEGGGGGGGAILVASTTRITLNGAIYARGSGPGSTVYWAGGAGSGGAIRLVAPYVFGAGTLGVEGGNSFGGVSAGAGRVRIDAMHRVDPNDASQRIAFSVVPAESVTLGANMMVFPPNNPRLRLTNIAGNDVVEESPPGSVLLLPFDAPSTQTVTVEARDFNAVVPVRVALQPESGDTAVFDAEIDNVAANPATVTVNVTVPVNTKVTVSVWMR